MTGSQWRDMFEQPGRNGGSPPTGVPPSAPERVEPDDDGLGIDMSVYRPWILQRGRSGAAMMLDLRRYEPRSGMWSGWALAYPHLIAVEYVGDRLLSLDFGQRQFVLEGVGLDELTRQLQRGTVLTIHQHSLEIWPPPRGPHVAAIRPVGSADGS